MPLWQIYHPSGTFEDDASKQAFAADITAMYVSLGLPAFYVVTQFHQIDTANFFVGRKRGGHTESPFMRIVITHIAINLSGDNDEYFATTSRLDQVVKTHVLDKGYDLEYHVDETDRRLWKMNGLIPPPFKSAEEKIWAQQNHVSSYDGAYPPKLL